MLISLILSFIDLQASLTIVMKPELSHLEEVTVEYYEETNIEVKVTANPKPKVKWYDSSHNWRNNSFYLA